MSHYLKGSSFCHPLAIAPQEVNMHVPSLLSHHLFKASQISKPKSAEYLMVNIEQHFQFQWTFLINVSVVTSKVVSNPNLQLNETQYSVSASSIHGVLEIEDR